VSECPISSSLTRGPKNRKAIGCLIDTTSKGPKNRIESHAVSQIRNKAIEKLSRVIPIRPPGYEESDHTTRKLLKRMPLGRPINSQSDSRRRNRKAIDGLIDTENRITPPGSKLLMRAPSGI
jgi:hypothetical protein